MKDRDLFARFCESFAATFAAVPAPIAPDAHKCLCDACECCADPAADVPAEAREASL